MPIRHRPTTLRDLRRDRGLTLRMVGKAIGVSHVFVSEIECGLRPLPLDRVADFARIYCLPEAAIMVIAGYCLHCHGTGRTAPAAIGA